MRSTEAKEYFRTVGSLHRDARIQSKEAGDSFLMEERQTPEYQVALTTLKLIHPIHFKREIKHEVASSNGFIKEQHEAILKRVSLSGPKSRLARLRELNSRQNNLYNLTTTANIASREITGVAKRNGRDALCLLLYSGQQQLWTLTEKQADILGKSRLEDQDKEVFELQRFIGTGSLAIKIDGVSLNDFAKEDFKNKRKVAPERVIQYLKYFMALREVSRNIDLQEKIQEQNEDQISRKYPFLYRSSIAEASRIVQSFDIFPLIESSNILRLIELYANKNSLSRLHELVSKAGEGITQTVEHNKQQVIQFTNRIYQLVFTPDLEGADEIRKVCMSYLTSDNKSMSQHLIGLMGIVDVPALIKGYRQCFDLMEKGQDTDFYNILASRMKELAESNKDVGIFTIDDLDSVITLKQTNEEPEQVATEIANIIQRLNKVPNWRDIDITEVNIPWEETGIKKPSLIELEFPNGNPLNLDLNLDYRNDYGEKLNIALKVNLSKKSFDWSILEDPNRYPDCQARFMEVIKAIFAEIYRQLVPEEKPKEETVIAPSAPLIAPKVKPNRLVSFVSPIKLKKTPKEVQASVEPIAFEDQTEYRIGNQILIPEDDSVDLLLQGVPNDQKEMIVKRMREFNDLGRGKFKRLEALGPNGKRQYSLRTGSYRVLLVEEEFSKGARLFTIRNIGNRNRIYDEVDY